MPDTLKGVDNVIRSWLTAYSDFWFNWLVIATLLVVAGLLFEGPEIWHEMLGLFRASEQERNIPKWKKSAGIIGWVLIVAGVAGEGVAETVVSKADGLVRNFDEIILADTQKVSSAARERAASAYERAARTEQETAQENVHAAKALKAAELARKEAEGSILQVAQANERASKNEKEAAQLRHDAEQERIERIRLEAIVAPRSLNLDQQRQIGKACGEFGGHNVSVFSYATDGEGAVLGMQIIAALRRAGIKIADDRASGMVTGGFDLGIHLRGPTSEEPFMECLKRAFTSIGHLAVAPINDPRPRAGSHDGRRRPRVSIRHCSGARDSWNKTCAYDELQH